MANLVLPKFGPRTTYCRTILVLGPFLSCKKWSYLAYFGPTLGLIFVARSGPFLFLQKSVLGTLIPALFEVDLF